MFYIAMSVAAALIGAGFATGKEIMIFFPSRGIFYVFLSVLLMFSVSILFSFRKKTNIDKFFEKIFIVFLASTFSVMLSAGGEAGFEAFNLPHFFGVLITYALCLFITHFSLKGIYIFSGIIAPLMIIAMVLISVNSLTIETFSSGALNSLTYAGCNLLSLLPFIENIKNKEKDTKKLVKGVMIGFIMILICAILIKLCLDKFYFLIETSPLPMVKIASLKGGIYKKIYSLLIYFAVLTTAVSCLFSITKKENLFFVSFPLLLISFSGFENLITNVYTFFGYLGAFYIIYIILTDLKGDKKYERKHSKNSEYDFRK